jgi:ATP-dependent RNA helicase MSS116
MVIGGTNINRERSGLSGSRCDLLIATPGRLQDHLDSTQGFVGRLWGVQVCAVLLQFFVCSGQPSHC